MSMPTTVPCHDNHAEQEHQADIGLPENAGEHVGEDV